VADPLVQQRVMAAGALLDAAPVVFPLPERTTPLFMHEVADIQPRALYAEHGELYGENLRPKIEAVPRGHGSRGVRSRRGPGRVRARRIRRARGFDLLLTPTLGFVPPPADIDEIATPRGRSCA